MKKTTKFNYKLIKSFEDACKKENIDPAILPDVSMIPEGMGKALIAAYKLYIIFQAINNGWTPNWGNTSEYKYHPWYWVLSSGFGFDVSDFFYTHAFTNASSHLCDITGVDPAHMAKNHESEKSVGIPTCREKTIL